MLYLLDASVLITANARYYPINQFPEFWEWLIHMATANNVKMPLEIFEEIREGPDDEDKDLLYAWLHDGANHDALVLDEGLKLTWYRRS